MTQEARKGVQVKLLAADSELYVLAQSDDRVAKERAMRQRQMKWLWERLGQSLSRRVSREEMLMKLGAPASSELKIEAPQEKDLVAQLMNFNQVVQQATEQYKPSVLTAYLYDLSRAFNSFYAECPVGSAAEPTRSSRLLLSRATADTLKQGLLLLGIEAPEKM